MEHENWILKSSSYMLLYESHFKCKGTYRLKIKVREKIYQATKNQNRVVMDIAIPNVNCGLWVIMICQYRFIDCKKYTPLVQDVDSGEALSLLGQEVYGMAL